MATEIVPALLPAGDRPRWRPPVPSTAPTPAASRSTCEDGRVVRVDGSRRNPVTEGYICAKVRRLRRASLWPRSPAASPRRRGGPKGRGDFERVCWDEALDLVADEAARRPGSATGARRSCPSPTAARTATSPRTRPTSASSAGSAPRTSRAPSAPRPPAGPPTASTARWPGVAYQDYAEARLIVLWGVNPSASGIHLVPLHLGGAAPRRAAGGGGSAADAAGQARRPAPGAAAGHRPAPWPSR